MTSASVRKLNGGGHACWRVALKECLPERRAQVHRAGVMPASSSSPIDPAPLPPCAVTTQDRPATTNDHELLSESGGALAGGLSQVIRDSDRDR